MAHRRTRQAPVLYVCLEGVQGFRGRILAAESAYGPAGNWFARLNVHVSLVRSQHGEEGAKVIAKAYQLLSERCGATSPGMIVIDTMARATAGDDENDVSDMMAFLEYRAAALARSTGAAVAVAGPKLGDIRGSSAIEGAADTVVRAERDREARTRQLYEKVKEGPEAPLLAIHFSGDRSTRRRQPPRADNLLHR